MKKRVDDINPNPDPHLTQIGIRIRRPATTQPTGNCNTNERPSKANANPPARAQMQNKLRGSKFNADGIQGQGRGRRWGQDQGSYHRRPVQACMGKRAVSARLRGAARVGVEGA